MKLTHMNSDGLAMMVDVSSKDTTTRKAKAVGSIIMNDKTISLIKDNNIAKGNVLGTAQVAGIMAMKQTSNLIPMCHGLNISGCDISFIINDDHIKCYASANLDGKTGIEMEVIIGVSIALATIYDMCKAIDKDMIITKIMLLEKTGGKSGHYLREE